MQDESIDLMKDKLQLPAATGLPYKNVTSAKGHDEVTEIYDYGLLLFSRECGPTYSIWSGDVGFLSWQLLMESANNLTAA